MSILSVLMKNLTRRPFTLRLPQEVPHPKGFRGRLKIRKEKCIGCGLCVYVCVSNAIQVMEQEDHCEWAYSPGRCTFCGRCMTLCPGEALHLEAQSVPFYFRPGALNEVHPVPYPPCAKCGRPTPPVHEAILARAFKEVTPEIVARIQLCQRCRQRAAMEGLVLTPTEVIPPAQKGGQGDVDGSGKDSKAVRPGNNLGPKA